MKLRLHYWFFLSFLPVYLAQAQAVDTTMWVPDGWVWEHARSGNTIYLAGGFTNIGPRTGSGVFLNLAEGTLVDRPSLEVVGTVNTAVPDGRGGWYLGGSFTYVQGVARRNLARIKPDGYLDATWNPGADSFVTCMTLANNTLYVGGAFDNIGGQARRNLASFDATTGQLTNWKQDADWVVSALAVSGNTLFVGGSFFRIGGQIRYRLAAIDITTGQVTGWHPNMDKRVDELVVAGNTVYAGGEFTRVGGQTRNRIAAIDATTGLPTTWNPGADQPVSALAVLDNTVYAGGRFTSIGGQPRSYLAALNATTGLATPWNPGASADVRELCIANNTIYVGGFFKTLGGQRRNSLAALHPTTGLATPWNPRGSGFVYCLVFSGESLFAGGNFNTVNCQPRNGLAAIDVTTGRVLPWDPAGNTRPREIRTMLVDDGKVYLGGAFTDICGQYRNGLASIDATTGQLTAWNPSAFSGAVVNSMAAANGTIYAGGYSPSSLSYYYYGSLKAIDATTGQYVTAGMPSPDQPVRTLALSGNTLYVGGSFTKFSTQNRSRLAAIDITTRKLTDWNPGADNEVQTLAVSGNAVYAGGSFANIGGQPRNRLACLDARSGKATPFNPNASNTVMSIALADNLLYAAGDFTGIGGQGRKNLACLDARSGTATAWDPAFGNNSLDLSFHNGVLYAGGSFSSVGNKSVGSFAAFGKDKPKLNWITGVIYADQNGNCLKDAGEKGIANLVVVAQPGNYFASTDSAGHYSLAVDTGSYTVSQVLPRGKEALIQQTCPTAPALHAVRFTGYDQAAAEQNFANRLTLAPHLSISVSSARRRRCVASYTTVSYVNSGTAAADQVQVHVKLPDHVVLVSANLAYRLEKDQTYVFTIGQMPAGASGQITIQDSVICFQPAIRGLTACTRAWITPSNPREIRAEWDRSDLSLKANCASNGTVRLKIFNTGENMADSSVYRVFLDAQLALVRNFKLVQGDSLMLEVNAQGRTVRLEAQQRPGHPTRRQANITHEGCASPGGSISKGYVAMLPQDDEEPEVDAECLPIVDSYDPNDKLAEPRGVTDAHHTLPGVPLHYTVRFQNTGTDVAYLVVIEDTLSDKFDLSTLQVTGASHRYSLAVVGKGKPVLVWTFNNINLPDSSRDQAGSNGFVKFTIRPLPGLALGTRIENTAHIYFDYNPAVVTNTVLNTLHIPSPLPAEPLAAAINFCLVNPTANAGPDRAVCEQDTVRMQAVFPLHGQGTWKRLSGTGTVLDPGNPLTSVAGLGYGENVFEWRIPKTACGGDSLAAQVTVTRNQRLGQPAIDRTGDNLLTCSTEGTTYHWYLNGSKLELTTRTIQTQGTGDYRVAVGDSTCQSDLSPSYPCYSNVTATAGQSRTLCGQDTVILQAVAPQYGQGHWNVLKGSARIEQPHHPNSLVSQLAEGENRLEWSIPVSTCSEDSLRSTIIITRNLVPNTPSIVVLGMDTLACSITGDAYQWYLDEQRLDFSTQRIPVSRGGDYRVLVSKGGCHSDSSAAFRYTITGIAPALPSALKIYPNPTAGRFAIVLTGNYSQPAKLTIVDPLGRNILDGGALHVNQVKDVDLSSHPNGMYFVKIHTPKGVVVNRIVKQ